MNIKIRLQLTILTVLCAGGIISLTVFMASRQMDASLVKVSLYADLVHKISALDALKDDYLINPRERGREQWQTTYNSLGVLLEAIQPEDSTEESRVASLIQHYQELSQPPFQLLTTQAAPIESNSVQQDLQKRLVRLLSVKFAIMFDEASRLVEESQMKVVVSQHIANWATMTVVVAMLVLSGSVLLLTSHRIIRSIQKLHEGTILISRGNLNRRVEIKGTDEIAKLAEAFNAMAQHLELDIAERQRAEEALRQSEQSKTILNQIATIFLTIPDEEMYGEVLAIVLQAVKSKFGIFGYIGDNGDLIIPSLTRGIWSECQVPGKSIVFPSDTWGESLWGRAIREKKAFYSDGPFRTPEGHVPIDHFLTMPIVFGRETIGLLSVANKEGGYTEENRELQESIANFISPILNARLQRDRQELERKRVEEALQQSEKRFRQLFDEAPVGYHEYDIEGRITQVNKTELDMLGYAAEEMIGRPVWEFIVEEVSRETIKAKIAGTLPPSQAFERTYRRKDGTFVPVSIEDRLLRDPEGRIVGIRSIIQNITGRKRAEEEKKKIEAQLIQAQKMESIGTLTGGVAHDFNNILTTIQGNTQLAMVKLKEEDPLYGDLKEIQTASVRAANLTRQLLIFSRKQPMGLIPLNLNETIENLLNMLKRLIGEDIAIQTELAPHLWTVMADPGNIEQVMMNLVVNAKDAMPKGGAIKIITQDIDIDQQYCETYSYARPGRFVYLSVEDTGTGMDSKILQRIFEPFFSTKEPGKGTGLGLSVVYGIVKQHEGWINAESEPGKGSVFKIYLPATFEKVQDKSKLKGIFLKDIRGKGERILLVEDYDAIRKMAKKVFIDNDYNGFIASNVEEAVEIFEREKGEFSLVISDVVLPDGDGLELVEQLLSRNPRIRVLLSSGYTDIKSQWPIIQEKGYRFLQKPYSIADLLRNIREVLEQGNGER